MSAMGVPSVERRDPLKRLVDGLALGLGICAVALALAEYAWQQVKPS